MKKNTKDNLTIYGALVISFIMVGLVDKYLFPALGLYIKDINYVVDLFVKLGITMVLYIPSRHALIKIFKTEE